MAVFSQRKLRKNGLFHFFEIYSVCMVSWKEHWQFCSSTACLYIAYKQKLIFGNNVSWNIVRKCAVGNLPMPGSNQFSSR